MRLHRCTDQGISLEQFYEEVAAHDHPVNKAIGAGMLALIGRLRALEHSRQAWGLTSHYHLVLLAKDTYRSPWYVTICVAGENRFEIVVRPREGDGDRLEAGSLDEAVSVIVDAMDRSGGWEPRA